MVVKLSEKKVGDATIIKDLECDGALRQRFINMGLLKGAHLRICSFAPLGDPMIIEIHDCKIAIRKSDAKKIIVQ